MKVDEDPDRLSFAHSVRVVRHKLGQVIDFPLSARNSYTTPSLMEFWKGELFPVGVKHDIAA
ncbi:hypothetical protein [Pseudochelatococcus sp. G4_1912]|uniref:hypothetical protein n=1 Tax=Pseudochelatococcus sp. G4_1912 TaxID=3114288 RepID=UPI0039C760F6